MEQNLGLTVFLKHQKHKKDSGISYVYLRITINGIRKELSTQRSWPVLNWNTSSGRANDKKRGSKILNTYLDALIVRCHNIKTQLLETGRTISASAIKDILKGREKERYILAEFREHNTRMARLVNTKEYSAATLQKYQTIQEHLKGFITHKYGKDDLQLKALDYEFINDYSYWLKSERHISINTTSKYIGCVKKIVLICLNKGFISTDPFKGFTSRTKEVIISVLNRQELKSISDKMFFTDRLRYVKDIFLFCCYTGLSYIDVKQLRRDNVQKGFDGELWLNVQRQKTNIATRLPLLPKAVQIMKKYTNLSKSIYDKSLLPVYSNQKTNEYLKEIAAICGIKKRLTFHVARHTFATTIALANGIPIETLSKMLGHKSIMQTQHYAKIQDLKVSEDMKKLKTKINKDG